MPAYAGMTLQVDGATVDDVMTEQERETEFLNVEEIAARLRVDQETVRRWLRQGKMNGVSLGRAGWRITRAEVERFLKERQR